MNYHFLKRNNLEILILNQTVATSQRCLPSQGGLNGFHPTSCSGPQAGHGAPTCPAALPSQTAATTTATARLAGMPKLAAHATRCSLNTDISTYLRDTPCVHIGARSSGAMRKIRK